MSKTETIKIRQGKLKQALLEQMKRTPTLEQSCQKVGVSRMTVHRWMKASRRFAEEVETALRAGREFVSDIAETQMFSLISQGKSEMIKYFLSHNNPRYGNKLEIKGYLAHASEPLTPEQEALIRNALQLALPQTYVENNSKPEPDQDGSGEDGEGSELSD